MYVSVSCAVEVKYFISLFFFALLLGFVFISKKNQKHYILM